MKRALLHIGTGKTGSTAIQEALTAVVRAGEAPFSYTVGPDPNQNLLVASYMPWERLPRTIRSRYGDPRSERFLKEIRDLERRLREGIEAHDHIIISAEFLCQLEDHEIDDVRDDLSSWGVEEFRVLLYARDPASRYLSSLQQRVKASSLVQRPGSYRDDALPAADRWAGVFPDVLVRPFDQTQLHQGDVVEDLRVVAHEFFGEPVLADVRPVRVNTSLSVEAMMVLRDYRARFHPENNMFAADSTQLRALLEQPRPTVAQTDPQLRPEVEAFITAKHAPDLEALAQRYGVTLRDPAAIPSVDEDLAREIADRSTFDLILADHDPRQRDILLLEVLHDLLTMGGEERGVL